MRRMHAFLLPGDPIGFSLDRTEAHWSDACRRGNERRDRLECERSKQIARETGC